MQRRSTNIQQLIQSTGLETLATDPKPIKNKGSLKGVNSFPRTTTHQTQPDISKLSCEDFMEWLTRKGYSTQDCQAFKGR